MEKPIIQLRLVKEDESPCEACYFNVNGIICPSHSVACSYDQRTSEVSQLTCVLIDRLSFFRGIYRRVNFYTLVELE